MKAKIFNWKNEEKGELNLPEDFFNKEINFNRIYELVRWQRACARQGSHKTKTRAYVSGGGKKPFRQKGTGRARQGSIRSPLNRAGGVSFGPQPRSYKYPLPSKVRKSALKHTLSYLLKEKKILFVEDMTSSEGKTKELKERLKNFKFKKALLVDESPDLLFKRACRNLKNFQTLSINGLNVYDLLKYQQVVMSKKGVSALEGLYKKKEQVK